jgi:hypothetical protein
MLDLNSTVIDDDNSFFNQRLYIKKRYTNYEILLHHYFYGLCKVYPKNIIIINNFVFFFIENRHYFDVRYFLSLMRKQMQNKKLLIIRDEKTLIRLLYNFFPDPYVHDIRVYRNIYTGKKDIIVGFLSFVDRGIAIGCKGEYIKAVNIFFKKYVVFDNDEVFPLNIKCKVVNL